MARVNIDNGESGLNVRNALNNMFTELYGSITVPVKIPGISANSTYIVPADSFVGVISATTASGTPTLRIGTTPNGQEIMADQLVGTLAQAMPNEYFAADTILYFTITGGGTVNIRMDILNDYF
jgi:hypothetical protein